ncbi:reverse transcriptase (RNA-dependent DNA polymerase) [Cellulophaga sp. RHA19]|uniref:antiviral reverse transcriptase Drt3a n=1 Tax=Cellulophaga sp. RHA19 TaxID=1798237 RepID=UPI000C2C2E95|nr:antiviral reverse transcriptase Drt3a [Cellulophaga sp. RHA19]PKB43063.1 reverse transcriptase (RNA-dependent DNA polymerase) [Cellulophaga sp. RHA19]
MLDQSFSYENFRILLDVENRKGRYLEDKAFFNSDFFKKSRDISNLIIDKNQEIRDESFKVFSIKIIKNRNYTKLDILKEEKQELKKTREKILQEILIEIAQKTDIEDYELKIKKGQIKWGSQLYEIERNPENYFVTKQLQRNIYKTFKVKQASRKTIIGQLSLLLNDGFPKIIIRTDIKKFYESIPHKELLAIIEENSLLSYPSKKIIKRVLNQYWNILIADGTKSKTDERQGIPRGIGFSAYLSELYLRGFDKKIKSLSNVTYYTRYVDDIIIIFTPSHRKEIRSKTSYINNIKNILLSSTKLELNTNKTEVLNLTKENRERKISQSYDLTYLGYKFKLSYTKKTETKYNKTVTKITKDKLQVFMSDDKLTRYKNKINASFSDYSSDIIKYASAKNTTERLLYKRLKFLTKNHQLFRRKSNVFIGIYFSNEFLTEPYPDLIELDKYLKQKISTLPVSPNSKIRAKLGSLSFEKGFRTKRIVRFNIDSFKNGKMIKIWKEL